VFNPRLTQDVATRQTQSMYPLPASLWTRANSRT
jgi:hypothetical protein